MSSQPDGAGSRDPDDLEDALEDEELDEPDEDELAFDDLEDHPEDLDDGMGPDDLGGPLDEEDDLEDDLEVADDPAPVRREEAVTALDGVDESVEEDDAVLREGEFVCRSCHMAKRETALADPDKLLCRDCV